MDTDENEDPEDRLEREQLKRSNLRMRRIAFRSGKISIWALGVAFGTFVLLTMWTQISASPDNVTIVVVLIFYASLLLVAPIAAMVDLCLVIRLALRGERGLKVPLLLGLPAALLSLFIAVLVLLFILEYR